MLQLLAIFVLLAGIVLIAYDFFMGSTLGAEKRENFRKRIGDFWVWAHEAKWTGLASAEADFLYGAIIRRMGGRLVSIRSFSIVICISLLLSFVCLFLFIELAIGLNNYKNYNLAIKIFSVFSILNSIANFLCFLITMCCLLILKRSTSHLTLIALLIVDIILAYFIAHIFYIISREIVFANMQFILELPSSMLAIMSYDIVLPTKEILESLLSNKSYQSVLTNINKLSSISELPFSESVLYTLGSEIILLALLTSVLPTLIHIIIYLAFALSKTTSKRIQRIIELVARGFYESTMSPFRIIGICLCFIGGILLRF